MQNYIEAIPNVIEAIQFPGNIAWSVNSCCQIDHNTVARITTKNPETF